jgi:hypothetical protein
MAYKLGHYSSEKYYDGRDYAITEMHDTVRHFDIDGSVAYTKITLRTGTLLEKGADAKVNGLPKAVFTEYKSENEATNSFDYIVRVDADNREKEMLDAANKKIGELPDLKGIIKARISEKIWYWNSCVEIYVKGASERLEEHAVNAIYSIEKALENSS